MKVIAKYTPLVLLMAVFVVAVCAVAAALPVKAEAATSPSVTYKTHVQTYGWEKAWKKDGQTSGTTGKSKRLEGIYLKLENASASGSIEYKTHIQTIGWQGWKKDGALSGTTGRSLRLEAIQIRLTGEMAKKYDVYYRVHAQTLGWMGWAKNGESAGTSGWSKRLEAIQVKLVAKGGKAPGSTANAFVDGKKNAQALREKCNIHTDYRKQFQHGPKNAEQTKYIVLHDTEGGGTAKGIINYWAGNGNRVAAHFIVQRDGQIWQCVPMDKIAHHAGYGNKGHNKKFGVTDESRDDKKGTGKKTSYLPDYGMNSYSIGIEMIHQGNQAYTKKQLESLDKLIAYIDTYYGKKLTIIDHKMWRIGNSDTSKAFKTYLANYRNHRSYK